MVTFDITDLKEGEVVEENAAPSAEALDLDPDTFSAIEVHVTLRKTSDSIEVAFDARATASLQGDRTLRLYEEPVSGSFAVTFKPVGEMTEADDDNEAVRSYSSYDTEVDITHEVRDTLLLALPLRQIAPGGENEQLQLEYGSSGEDEGVDLPEWKQKLKELRDESDNDSV